MRNWPLRATLAAGALVSAVTGSGAQDHLAYFGQRWTVTHTSKPRAGSRLDGRVVLPLESGEAILEGVTMQDGTIDLELKMADRRSFVYLIARLTKDRRGGEEFYIRPHKSGLPDALQYAPVYQGHGQWQLYWGEEGTAGPRIPRERWTHVRLVLSGQQAAWFVGDTNTPALLVRRLGRPAAAGEIALRSFATPADSTPAAWFANVRVRPGVVAWHFDSVPPPAAAPPGTISAWEVGPVTSGDSLLLAVPAEAFQNSLRVASLPNGMTELHRWLPMPEGARVTRAFARVQVEASTAGTRIFDLGFSDLATVFLNGRPIWRGVAEYSFPMRRDGVVGYHQSTLFLPLIAGLNVLEVQTSDRFGGWAVMGRFRDPAGLTIAAGGVDARPR